MSAGGVLRRLVARVGTRQRGFAEAGVAVTGAALVLGAALGSGVASTVVTMSDGVTWLPDAETGQVVQINPATGRAERRLQVGEPGGELGISQRDGLLLVTDAAGTVHGIDLATLLEGGARGSAEPTRVLVAQGRVHLVTPSTGVVQAVDPLTLHDLGTPYRAGVALADAVVDEQGTVWLATVTGELRSVTWDPDDRRFVADAVRRVRGAREGTRLLPHARGVTVFAPDRGTVLQVGAGRDVAVTVPDLTGEVLPATVAPADLAPAGVPGRSAVVILAGTRVLDVAVGTLGCTRPGHPAVFAGRVYVPCTGDGRVVVLAADGTRARPDVVMPAGRDPRLIVDDGRLVAHTEDGSQAVVVEADGRTRVIDTGRSSAPVHDPRGAGTSTVTSRPPVRVPVPGAVGVPGDGPPGAGGGGQQGAGPGVGGPTQGPGAGAGDATPSPQRTGHARPGTPRPTSSARVVAPPSDVEAAPGTPDVDGLSDVLVTWRPAAAPPDAYVVRASVGAAPVEVDGRGTSATVRGVACGTRLTFTVEAVEGTDRSVPASSPAVRTAACPAAPAPPGGVVAVPEHDGAVVVTWTPSADVVDHYLVGPVGGSTTRVAADATSVTLRDVLPGEGVRFGVQAVRGTLTSRTVLSAPVDVAGPPGAVAPLTATLSQQSDTTLTVVLRWTTPPTNGSQLSSFVVAWNGAGVASGSITPGAFSGCSAARGCDGPRTSYVLDVPCAGAGLCTGGGPLTVSVAARNGVGDGPVATAQVDVPEAPTRLTAVRSIEPVTPAADETGVRMAVRLEPPQPFLDHTGACVLELEHSDGTRTSTGWSCRSATVVVGPFGPGRVTVVASALTAGGGSSVSTVPYSVSVPSRDELAACDPPGGTCADPAALVDAPVSVVPVPYSPRLPAGTERPPVAATGAGLILAAAALRARRQRRPAPVTPAPHATPEETPA